MYWQTHLDAVSRSDAVDMTGWGREGQMDPFRTVSFTGVCPPGLAGGWRGREAGGIPATTRPLAARGAEIRSAQQSNQSRPATGPPEAASIGTWAGEVIRLGDRDLKSAKQVSDHPLVTRCTPWRAEQLRCSLAANFKWPARPVAREASSFATIAPTARPVWNLG